MMLCSSMPSFRYDRLSGQASPRLGRSALMTASLVAALGVLSGPTLSHATGHRHRSTRRSRARQASPSSSAPCRSAAETVSVDRTAAGWTIRSSGRADVPIDLVARDVRVRYTADWQPIDLTIDATIRGQVVFGQHDRSTARPRTTSTRRPDRKTNGTDPIAANALLLAESGVGAVRSAVAAPQRRATRAEHSRIRTRRADSDSSGRILGRNAADGRAYDRARKNGDHDDDRRDLARRGDLGPTRTAG